MTRAQFSLLRGTFSLFIVNVLRTFNGLSNTVNRQFTIFDEYSVYGFT